jgi:hypothetical protein
LDSPNNQVDLSIYIKKALLHKPEGMKNIVNIEALQDKLLKSNLDKACNYDSLGNQVNKAKNNWAIVHRDSNYAKVVKLVQFINCLYIAFTIPFIIAFNDGMETGEITIEAISICL